MRGHLLVSVLLASCSGGKAPATTPTPPEPAPPVDNAAPAAAKPAPVDPIDAKVRAMGQIKSARSPSFSPDGTRLAFTSDAGGLPEVYVVPVAGGTPERVTKLQDPIGGVAWSPDGAWLAISVAPGGGMNSQLYRRHRADADHRRR